MLYFKRNDLMDQVFDRYLVSAERTLDTRDVIGEEMYQTHLNHLTFGLKKDHKLIDKEGYLYLKYKLKRNKLEVKLIKIEYDFTVLSDEELESLSRFNLFRYNSKVKRIKALNRAIWRLDLKYRLIIANCEYEPDDQTDDEIDEKVDDVTKEGTDEETGCAKESIALSATSETSDEKEKTSTDLFNEIFGIPKDDNNNGEE